MHIEKKSSAHHVIARFEIALDAASPKAKGVRSGYAPHHRFAKVDYLASGFHVYGDNEFHFPGETLEIKITFPSWSDLRERLKVGDRFDVLELDRVIGHGTIERINETS